MTYVELERWSELVAAGAEFGVEPVKLLSLGGGQWHAIQWRVVYAEDGSAAYFAGSRYPSAEECLQYAREDLLVNIYESLDLFPHLSGDMLQGSEVTLTIAGVREETIHQDEKAIAKLAVTFAERPKTLLLNRTNARALAKAFGPETDAWAGKRVTLYSERIKAFGKWVDTIRVKPAPAARAKAEA